jgi:hypothetical protein
VMEVLGKGVAGVWYCCKSIKNFKFRQRKTVEEALMELEQVVIREWNHNDTLAKHSRLLPLHFKAVYMIKTDILWTVLF